MQGMESTFPPDVVTTQPDPPLSYNSETDTIYQANQQVNHGADISFNYDDYQTRLGLNTYDYSPPTGQYMRREVAIPIGDCSGTINGQGQVPVLGFGCYFLLQEAIQKGNEAEIFGLFLDSCNAGGVPGPEPDSGPGLYIIQLYKDPDSPDA